MSKKELQLKDIYFGKTDAYNEYLEYGTDTFKGLFFEFPNIDISKLLNGSTYYIFGNKGTGKTMLLKYLESVVLEEPATQFTEFIRFKRDIDDEERNKIKRSSVVGNSFEEIIDKDIPNDFTLDCSLAWQVYLIKVIVNRLAETEYGVFDRTDENWIRMCDLIEAMYGSLSDKSSVKKILPQMKRGNITLKYKEAANLNLEFEWEDEEKKQVPFSTVAKEIVDLYSKLKPVEDKIYIFIDELELSFKNSKKYQRDVALIRDLIFAIEYLSDTNRTKGYNVYLLTAIRSEVYKQIISKGMEINKTVHDFGVLISWEQKGGNLKEHPLLKMLEKRIRYTEEQLGIEPAADVWDAYFVPTISESEKDVKNYILDQTWLKPRDIIRLFTIIQQQKALKTKVDQECFDAARKRYAEESWAEFEEYLTVKYSDTQVEGIKKTLTGLKLPFTVKDFENSIKAKKGFYEEVAELSKIGVPGVLKDLYNVGIIGNYGSNSRFIFKGDDDIDPTMPITIHYPLIRFFKASITFYTSRSKNAHISSDYEYLSN
ncbi:P-loop ATPase, Sll1717 family [Butyrivibrio sp. MC2013]|uniref:P-loop ATPase, Sll1717 family n=1 Tax=Butyrivibrio sp. MC2013 TaxID=1280686 RepID=UPI000405BBA4|nr:hypothetical protein [Butyrivibrio sp. MC2013]